MYCQPRPNYCKKPTTTQVMPAKVFPTQQNIVEKTCEYIVPEVYPTHTANVTNHVYKHVKSFPQTQSFNETISNQQFVAPAAAGPGFGPQAGGPGFGPQVAGAAYGPQAGGPGFGPQVAGAAYGPQVAGAMTPPRPNMMAPMGQMGGYGKPHGPNMGAMAPMQAKGYGKSCGC